MKKAEALLVLTTVLLLAACAPGAATPTQTVPPATTPLLPSETPSPAPTATPMGQIIYDFQELFCQANWKNSGQHLECPSSQTWLLPGNGYIGLMDLVTMEGTATENETALVTHPAENGSFLDIFGEFPPITIKAGDEFRATLACLDGQEPQKCDVAFSLEYYDENGNYISSDQTGWTWNERQDGHVTNVNVDLSSLAGRTVRLTLAVRDNGDPTGDYAVWLHPQLWRIGQ